MGRKSLYRVYIEFVCGVNDGVEVRNDLDEAVPADYHMDALDFVNNWRLQNNQKFDTVLLDPPYSFRKSMEYYNGNRNSR